VGDILLRSGATLEESGDGTYTYLLSKDLSEFLQRERVTITFRKRAARRVDVELASPGSWFHDQLLRFARQRGRVAEGFLPARDGLDRDALVRSRRRGFLGLGDLKERRYGTLLVFTLRLSYYSEPAQEEVRHVTFDCERGRVVKRPISKKLLRSRVETPEGAFADPPKTNIKAGFAAAWESVQDAVELRVRDIQQDSRPLFAKKIKAVERYYKQLLAEEKRLLKTRSSRRGEDASREKIDMLKLEWKRRITEETERLKPQVVAVLSAVARVWVPLERWSYTLEEKGEQVEKDLWLDLARADVWERNHRTARRKR
jgi:hypothetical protein